MGNSKINEALGIESLDGLMKDLNIDQESRKLDEIESQMKENVEKIDSQVQLYQEKGLEAVNVGDLNESLNEIRDLINISKQTIQHVYESIQEQEIVDSESVQALSKLIESSHLAVKEYIDIFRDRVSFYDKVRLEAIKHQYKIQQMQEKNRLDIEKINKTKTLTAKVIPQEENKIPFSVEGIIKELN